MNPLIEITTRVVGANTVPTCNARDLWRFLESKRQFSDWINPRLFTQGLVEGEDFIIHKIIYDNNPEAKIDYYLTLDTAKNLAMIELNDKGKEIRNYFIECEKRFKIAQFNIPTTYADALQLAADFSRELDRTKVELAITAPKAIALDRIATASLGNVCVSTCAKELQMQPKELFAFLAKNKWIYKRTPKGVWLPYEDKLKARLLEVKVSEITLPDGRTKKLTNFHVTPRGLTTLAQIV